VVQVPKRAVGSPTASNHGLTEQPDTNSNFRLLTPGTDLLTESMKRQPEVDSEQGIKVYWYIDEGISDIDNATLYHGD
jgi:hypothetical protein